MHNTLIYPGIAVKTHKIICLSGILSKQHLVPCTHFSVACHHMNGTEHTNPRHLSGCVTTDMKAAPDLIETVNLSFLLLESVRKPGNSKSGRFTVNEPLDVFVVNQCLWYFTVHTFSDRQTSPTMYFTMLLFVTS